MQFQRMEWHQWKALTCVTVCLLSVLSVAPTCMAKDRHFDFTVSNVNYTRNCVTKPLLAVNGEYPGPTVEIYEGDRVVVKLTNAGNYNVTVHWHGIRQMRSGWQDGTAYITECPLQPGNTKIYDFVVVGQRGTTFWHAHASWIRATVYGAFITLPDKRPYIGSYPFPKPYKEVPVLLGEWWNADVVQVEQQGLAAGTGFALADAMTINGYPGPKYNCSDSEGVAVIDVEPGKTYLLRIINAALNTEMFFSIACHTLTVVEIDSVYVKPFTVGDKGIIIGPGQTTNVLVTADQSTGTYYMVGESFDSFLVTDPGNIPPPVLPIILKDVPPIPTTGFFQYKDCSWKNNTHYPAVAAPNDTAYANYFANSLRVLYPDTVPHSDKIRHLFYTVGLGTEPCTPAAPCSPQAYNYSVSGMMNNISFVYPTTAILQAYFYKIPGVYSPTFPDYPLHPYNYTAAGSPPNPGQVAALGTRVAEIEYGTVVELVMQNVNNLGFENHPYHLHGHSFYVMGQGSGNYDAATDPKHFNYYDPPSRNTVNVPVRGWVAIRFLADNPGVWMLHCHLEKHMSLGMQTAFIVKNGRLPNQTLPAPPMALNPC